jgi:hypothetical protein
VGLSNAGHPAVGGGAKEEMTLHKGAGKPEHLAAQVAASGSSKP